MNEAATKDIQEFYYVNTIVIPQICFYRKYAQLNFNNPNYKTFVRVVATHFVARVDGTVCSCRRYGLFVSCVRFARDVGRTPKEIWDKLHSLYGDTSEDAKQDCWQQFYDFRIKNGMPVATQLEKFETICKKLDDAGEKPPDSAVMSKLLNSLPSRFSAFTMAWECTAKDERKKENLIARIIREDKRLTSMEEESSSLALQVKALQLKLDEQEKMSSNYQKVNDSKDKRKKNSKSIEELKRKHPCKYCNELGHWYRECEKRMADEGKGRKMSDDSASAYVCDISAFFSETTDEDKSVWLADSGASLHMTFRRDFFSELRPVGKIKLVQIASDMMLPVAGIGTIYILAEVHGKKVNRKLTNVLLVPDLKRNLFSVGAINDKNFSFHSYHNHCEVRERSGALSAKGVRHGSLFRMLFEVQVSSKCNVAEVNSLKLWHERLGHINVELDFDHQGQSDLEAAVELRPVVQQQVDERVEPQLEEIQLASVKWNLPAYLFSTTLVIMLLVSLNYFKSPCHDRLPQQYDGRGRAQWPALMVQEVTAKLMQPEGLDSFVEKISSSAERMTTVHQGAAGVIPEASQEGLLHPFKSYADITLFHYNVPPEVYRATWEFAAFMDNPKCAVKEVYIFVQHGGYPLVNPSNSSFPSMAYTGRTSLQRVETKTAYQPHDATIIPIYNPLPGNWFVAAYMANWNDNLQQEPTPQELIQPSFGERIFIPTGTWQFSVTVSNCTFHVKSFLRFNKADTYCIEGLALEARALPPYDLKSGVGNLTTKTQHTFIENEPFTDGYYYLLVISKSQVNFTIHVITTDLRSSLADKFLFYLSFAAEPELPSLPPHFVILGNHTSVSPCSFGVLYFLLHQI
uniref:Retrovirus-related Pol polyprotein from transposon TNT 1-94-like beta-barrel domain-containing protein n=1 Tax=Timema monikensis TaxID=170555 RepID=A0A7R9DXE3_9NEOP|nr:unnamed protein product [Timema monikensis]